MNTRRAFLKIIASLVALFPWIGSLFSDKRIAVIPWGDDLDSVRMRINFHLSFNWLLGYEKFRIENHGDRIHIVSSTRMEGKTGKPKFANTSRESKAELSVFVRMFNFYASEMERFGPCGFQISELEHGWFRISGYKHV